MSQTKNNNTPFIIAAGVILALIVLFVIGLNTKRDIVQDPNEHAWEEYLEGEWAYITANDVEMLIGFGQNRHYADTMADPQFANLARRSTYRFVDATETTATLELLPETSEQQTMILALTRTDDAHMTGNFLSDDSDMVLDFDRRR